MITAGEVIKKKRESLGKSIHLVSADTKIQRRFLEYIENNEFDKFDSEVFASGFIKIYAKYLGLDIYKILALYRRDNLKHTKSANKATTKKKKIPVSPKLIAIITISLFLISVIGYIVFQILKFQTPPELVIIQPQNEYVSEEEKILLKGSTKPKTMIEIDNQQIQIDDEGFFETEILLREGVNTINIKARKEENQSLQTTSSIKVIYKPIKQEENIEEKVEEFLITISISQSPSWIKLDIDGENKISEVLQPNTIHEFLVLENFTLVTGRLQNTTLEINSEQQIISSSSTTGIGQISCNIEENKILCE
jgi:cytoskeletal protein RodZ